MRATTAEETHRLLAEAFNRGDVEALLDLYEDGALFLAQPGAEPARGTAAVREALNMFVGMKGTFAIQQTNVLSGDDVALVYSSWTLKGGSDPDGNPLELAGTTTDVVRRQTDGSWLFSIDNPWGVQSFATAPTRG